MLKQDQFAQGQRLTRPGPPMTLQAFADFGALLGTDAPIHNDPAYAARTPFGNVISQGPLLLACYETWLCELFGEDAWSRTGRLAAKFVAPAKVGEEVTLELIAGEIVGRRATFALRVTCKDRLLAVGSAAIDLP
jgi:3-hydroxybutyryl-CoA dehydratase